MEKFCPNCMSDISKSDCNIFYLFEAQNKLQTRLGNLPILNDEHRQDLINMNTIACVDELFEALRETPWKPWKKNKIYSEEKFKDELIDAWHFLINLSIISGMDYKELFDRFFDKNKENHKRQDVGY